MVKYINQINIALLGLALALSLYAFSETFLSPPPQIDIIGLPEVDESLSQSPAPTSRSPSRRSVGPATSRPQRSEGRTTQRPSVPFGKQTPNPALGRRADDSVPSRTRAAPIDPEQYTAGPGRVTPNPQWMGRKTSRPADSVAGRSSGRRNSGTDSGNGRSVTPRQPPIVRPGAQKRESSPTAPRPRPSTAQPPR